VPPETRIGSIDASGSANESLRVSPDSKRVAYTAKTGNKSFVVIDGKEGKRYDGILRASGPIFSPDSKRVAYGAETGTKQVIVVDGKEGKQYDGIATPGPIFSPDSKHLAYAIVSGSKSFVIVDGKEGKRYNGIINFGGGRIVFDSADSLHYLALKGTGIYLVQENIKR